MELCIFTSSFGCATVPSPDELFRRIKEDVDGYRKRFFAYLESIMRQDLPDELSECYKPSGGQCHAHGDHEQSAS